MDYQESKTQPRSKILRILAWPLQRMDFLQLIPMAILITIGLLFIYSTGQQAGDETSALFWKKQLNWVIIGTFSWIVLGFTNYKHLRYWIIPLYIGCILLLVAVPFMGIKVYGAKRWLAIGPMRVQPSEFAKLAILIATAWFVSLKVVDINKIRWMILLGIIIGVPFVLIMLQPDLGSSLVLLPVAAAIVFAANLKWRFIVLAILLAIIAVPSSYPFLSTYQKERILVFLDPDRDPTNRGWNQLQAEIAVGSGGFLGKGFMQGTQNTLGFLPKTVSNTDFIFSVIAEETGFMGASLLVGLYILLLFAALRTAILASDEFGRCMAVGIAAIFFFHSVVNIGMSIRIMPVTGIPLPFISYGGSFMLTCMICMGILQSIYAHRHTFNQN